MPSPFPLIPPGFVSPQAFATWQQPVPSLPPAPAATAIVNQWAGTFSQPAAFGPMPPALQSAVVALTPASSVGPGTGTPTPGNWLFCIAGWQQESGTSPVTVGKSDDIHSWWRPAGTSSASGNSRTCAWYTPNIARTVTDVYISPNGALLALSVLIVEVSGLGPWDTVTGSYTSYADAATALSLSLPAPSAQALVIAAVAADNAAAGMAFAPAGWDLLQTVTATNGVNDASDSVLSAACITTLAGQSPAASAGSTVDLSGVIIGVLTDGPSPIPSPSTVAPGWAGRTILEAGFGSGFQTPQDEITWTVLNDSAANPYTSVKRLWGWSETTGVQYNLGQIRTSDGTVQVDNADGLLSPSNAASPYFPYCQTGTPVRIRFAIGGDVNRWYVWSRNGMGWPEVRNKALRGYVPLTIGDIWATCTGPCYTPYRGEVAQDSPGWWWPCDDQALIGGVLPTQLRNAAPGNTNPLLIEPSPNGIPYQDLIGMEGGVYGTTIDLTAIASTASTTPTPGVAVYNVGQQQGWMYGDPSSSPSAAGSAGGAITASPGSAAWQQTGFLGTTGAYGWFLACEDSYPALSGGVTIEGWFSAGFLGSATSADYGSNYYVFAAQPSCPMTLLELATATAPVAVLQLGDTGHLSLITYNGATGTTHTIYTASDLRCGTFFSVTLSLTTTTWNVQINGGITANVSGTATGMTSAWTWLIGCGDLGTGGGSALSGIVHGGNMAVSHLSVYPRILPQSRILAHYSAAVTGFGQLPAPSGPALAGTANDMPTGYTPDGTEHSGQYGKGSGVGVPWSMSMVTAAVAGSYTSGPSARIAAAGIGTGSGSSTAGAAIWASATALAPAIALYTSADANAETEASVILGAGDVYTAGYGSGATGAGVCHVSGGSGASPPTAASALGDSAAQRIERILGYGQVTYPSRAVDATATQPVQAALDIGGQQTGQGTTNIAKSDCGMHFVDNMGTISYRSRPHLASDTPVWSLGPATSAGQIPCKPSLAFGTDPVRTWTTILATPYAPDGSTPPDLAPTNATGVAGAVTQYGSRPYTFTSYLQSQSEIQTSVNWLFSNYGQNQRRVTIIEVDAAGYPPAWEFVAGVNCSDLIEVTDVSVSGAPTTTGTYRVSQIKRDVSFGANGLPVTASVAIVADFEPSSYFS